MRLKRLQVNEQTAPDHLITIADITIPVERIIHLPLVTADAVPRAEVNQRLRMDVGQIDDNESVIVPLCPAMRDQIIISRVTAPGREEVKQTPTATLVNLGTGFDQNLLVE